MLHVAVFYRRRFFTIVAVALCGSLAMMSPPAFAQLTDGGTPLIGEVGPITDMQSDPFAGTFQNDVVTLTGAANITPTPGGVVDPFVTTSAKVTVGEHPVQITPTLDASFRLVNGGGTLTDPNTTVSYEAAVNGTTSGQPTIFASASTNLVGNGSIDTSDSGDTTTPASYVLASGVTYDIEVLYSIRIDATSLTTSDPSSVVTLESGGGDFFGDGLSFALNPVELPEPASMSLIGGALLVLAHRRVR